MRFTHPTLASKKNIFEVLLPTKNSHNLLLLAGILWVASLAVPTIEIPREAVYGFMVFVIGVMGVFSLFFSLAQSLASFSSLLHFIMLLFVVMPWLANPLLLLSALCLRRGRYKLAFQLSVATLLFMIKFSLDRRLPLGPDFSLIQVDLRLGYFLWVLSGACLVALTFFFHRRGNDAGAEADKD